jgi:hypothetical protein
MGFMDKIKNALIEEDVTSVNVGPAGRVNVTPVATYEPIIEVDTTNVLSIDNIYEAGCITDRERSIYKVEEIRKILPDSLTKEAKKASVVGMLSVSKITVEEVCLDADKRTELLLNTLEQFTQETVAIRQQAQVEIDELEAQVEAKKAEVTARNLEQEKQGEIITTELEAIRTINEFIK